MPEMEHRLVSLLRSPLRLPHLHRIHALLLVAYPNLAPLFLAHLLTPSTARYARQVFDSIPQPDPDICHFVISSYSKIPLHRESIQTFFSAHRKAVRVLFLSIPLVLKSCALSVASCEGRQVHSHAFVRGFISNVFIQTALIDLYAKIGDMDLARKVFNEISVDDPIPINCLISGYSKSGNVLEARKLFDAMTKRTSASWNSMITCYAHNGDLSEALELFERMQRENARVNEITLVAVLSVCAKRGDLKTGLKVKELIDNISISKGLIVQTALLELFVKCGAVDDARQEFDKIEIKDVVAWSAMIAGYAQNGRSLEALKLFEQMRVERCKPNEVTLVSVLSACAQLGSVEIGEHLGKYVEKLEIALGVYVGSALVDMHSKCGNVKGAQMVFNRMRQKDVVTWNAMIGGLAVNGLAKDAISLFKKMGEENVKPNQITFVSLLTACTHAGLVDLGLGFFSDMKSNHGILPEVEHCACIVDLFCRLGRLHDAYNFICEMEVEPNVVIWGTLLSACRLHSNVELAELCAQKLLVLEPHNSANYVLMSNIYANARQWEDARKVRGMMKNKNVQKVAANSWIELGGEVHNFLVEDVSHPKFEEIYNIADYLGLHLKWASYDNDLYISLL